MTAFPCWYERLVGCLHRRCYAAWNRHQCNECHKIARRICWMGFDNEKWTQADLDVAKDALYSAALRFKAEADSASNEKVSYHADKARGEPHGKDTNDK